MRRYFRFLLAVGALLFCPVPAVADLILPSVAKMLSAPGPCTLLVIPAIITVPLLLAVSLLETFVARLWLKQFGFARLLGLLFLVNAITSVIGAYTLPNGTELWPGVPLAYAATTLLEGIALLMFLRPFRRSVRLAFGVSAAMNATSYAFLTLLLAALIYLPAALAPNNLAMSRLGGRIWLADVTDNTTEVIDLGGETAAPRNIRGDGPKSIKPLFAVVSKGTSRVIVSTKTGATVANIKADCHFRGHWAISENGRYFANWVDAEKSKGLGAGDLVVGDSKTGRWKSFAEPEDYKFSPVDSRIAIVRCNKITVYDPVGGETNSFRAPGLSSRDITWSPDGAYIAYIADLSPFTHDLGDSWADSVRITRADGEASLTLIRRKKGLPAWGLSWTP